MSDRRGLLYYEAETVTDTVVVGRMCWRCLGWPVVRREIVAYLLIEDDGVARRVITWHECATCRHRSPSRSEDR